MKWRSSSSFSATPIDRLNASGQRAPPWCSSVAASAQSTASAMPGALLSGSRRSFPTAATTARAVCFGDAGGPHHHDARLALGGRIVDPVIDAAAPQRLVQVARAVRRQHHDRMLGRAQRAALGNRNLEIGEEFEQESFELLVGAVDFVDQQHRRVRRAQAPRASAVRSGTPRRRYRCSLRRPAGSPASGADSSTRRARRRRRCPRSIAAGSACGRARRRSPSRLRSCRRRARLPAATACRARARDRTRSRCPSSAR